MCQNPNKPEQMSCLADQIHPLGVLEVPTCLVSTSACTRQNPLFFQNILSDLLQFYILYEKNWDVQRVQES